MRRFVISTEFFVGFALLLAAIDVGLSAGVSGCSSNARIDSIHASLVAVDAARDGFVVYDRQHQDDIVDHATSREDGVSKLVAYRKDREAILNGFEIAYRLLATAATQNDDQSLSAALRAAGDLVSRIKGITAPAEKPPASPSPAPGGP